MKNNIKRQDKIFLKASMNPKYKGKQVIVVGDEIHVLSTRSKEARKKLITSLVEKYPEATPTITLIPKDNTLILIA